MRLFYFFLLIFSAVFHVLYKGDLSFVLLGFVVILPFFTLALLIITALKVRVTAQLEQLSAARGSTAVLKLTIKNNSVFPIVSCAAEIRYKPSVPLETPTVKKFRMSASIGARSEECFALNIKPEHCGTVDIAVTKIRLRDIMGLFSIPVKSQLSGKITSLPIIYPIQASVESAPASYSESSTFSQIKSGDDPSEIFALREYRDGDNNNRIHWKLSSRSENFIVKELSLPVGCRVLIITDFVGCKKAADVDKILDTAFSISHFLTEYGTAHSLAYACSDCTIHSNEITEADKFHIAKAEICNVLKDTASEISFAEAVSADGAFYVRNSFSRIIAVVSDTDIARADELEALCGEAYLTIICTGSPNMSRDDEECRAEIIYADAEKLSSRELLII